MADEELAKAVLSYEHQLKGAALAYLLERGLTAATIRRARLGYVGDPFAGHRRFADSVAIPYLSPDGGVRGIRFRYLNPSRNKYDSPKGVKIHLYGVENTTARHVWLCEGEFDSLVLSQLGYPAVGVPGVSSFKPNWKYLFASADSVTIVMDGDEAGRRGANRIASILGEVCANLRLAALPQGKDITDIYLSNERHLRALVE